MCLEEAELCVEFRNAGESAAAVPLLWKKDQHPGRLHSSGFLLFPFAMVRSLPCWLQTHAQVLCFRPRCFCCTSTDLINTALSHAMCHHLVMTGNDVSEKKKKSQARQTFQTELVHSCSQCYPLLLRSTQRAKSQGLLFIKIWQPYICMCNQGITDLFVSVHLFQFFHDIKEFTWYYTGVDIIQC